MRKIYSLYIIAALACGTMTQAQEQRPMTYNTERGQMEVRLTFDLKDKGTPSTEAHIMTPTIVSDIDSVELSSVGIYGRTRYYQYQRFTGGEMATGATERYMLSRQRPDTLHYANEVWYMPWMRDCRLVIWHRVYGCCETLLREWPEEIANFMLPPALPTPTYLMLEGNPVVEGALEGSALIQFIVDRTEVRPDWKNNEYELAKITNSIDTVKNDPDLTITGMWFKGFASPESPYSHNTDLAKGRTKNVKEFARDYVKTRYNETLPDSIFSTDYEPEDWAGLRRYVDASSMEHRDEILALIDEHWDDLDKKEDALKRRYPKEYRFLLNNAYPPLRHTEYKVKYRVRRFFDVNEIKRVMATEPGKLTLNDYILAASTYETGSEEFCNVYRLCAQLYPNFPEANINAAYAELQAGHIDEAERYLRNAGNRAEAGYARALVQMARGQYKEALVGITTAAKNGVDGAAELQEQLEHYLEVVK